MGDAFNCARNYIDTRAIGDHELVFQFLCIEGLNSTLKWRVEFISSFVPKLAYLLSFLIALRNDLFNILGN